MSRVNIYIVFSFMLAISSSYAQSWRDTLRLGQKLYQQGEFEKAYKTLLSAQKLAPAGVDLSQDIGNAAYRSEDFDLSQKAYAASAQKQKGAVQQADAWHNTGNSQMMAKDYQNAIESYKNSLRLNPQNDETRYNLAMARQALKKEEQQKQDKQQNKQNQQNQQQNDNSDSNENNSQNQQSEDQKDDKSQKNQSQGNSGNGDDKKQSQGRLNDQKSDRILDDLLKQELETKKKVQKIEQSEDAKASTHSGKKW